jgi:hypothetical protein
VPAHGLDDRRKRLVLREVGQRRELVDEQTYPRLYRIAWSARTRADPSTEEEREFLLLTRVEQMSPGPYPKIELGEPVHSTGPAGSVLLRTTCWAITSAATTNQAAPARGRPSTTGCTRPATRTDGARP